MVRTIDLLDPQRVGKTPVVRTIDLFKLFRVGKSPVNKIKSYYSIKQLDCKSQPRFSSTKPITESQGFQLAIRILIVYNTIADLVFFPAVSSLSDKEDAYK